MSKNYRQLADSVKTRLNPDNIPFQKSLNEELTSLSNSEVLTYVRLAMSGVEPEYTQKSMDAGERVKTHLKDQLSDVEFRYQGSVMTNIHIKGHSDIDLLTICYKFYKYDASRVQQVLYYPEIRSKYDSYSINKLEKEVNSQAYTGNSLNDLRSLRVECERILSDKYFVCDKSKPKSIKIKNLSVNREVDVAIANWYDDVSSIINDKADNKGIQIYNKDTDSLENPDYPFLSIKQINDRGRETGGRLKMMIRFLKNCKANLAHDIKLSSFDINSICYDIEKEKYQSLSYLHLVPVLHAQIKGICTNIKHSNDLISVDRREYIFRYNTTKSDGLKFLLAEVKGVLVDLYKNMLL